MWKSVKSKVKGVVANVVRWKREIDEAGRTYVTFTQWTTGASDQPPAEQTVHSQITPQEGTRGHYTYWTLVYNTEGPVLSCSPVNDVSSTVHCTVSSAYQISTIWRHCFTWEASDWKTFESSSHQHIIESEVTTTPETIKDHVTCLAFNALCLTVLWLVWRLILRVLLG